jgi:hypothetical protein
MEENAILLECLKLGRQIVAITADKVRVLVITGWVSFGKSKMKQQTQAFLDEMRIKHSMPSKGSRISLF